MSASAKATRQYLQRYAETEIMQLDSWPLNCCYRHVVLIPAYRETLSFLHTILNARWFNRDVLVILVLNQPDVETDLAPQQALYDTIVQCGKTQWQVQNLQLIAPHLNNTTEQGHILLVDRFTTPIPEKQGVGLARKLGADLALALINQGIIQTEWIGSTDADASLPDDYFTALTTVPAQSVAACYDFKHIANHTPANTASAESVTVTNTESDEITAATLLYERALRYYVAGLHYAGSPYAQFTIGSILAFKASAYAQVRGFPKRAAGEDFYLLNKLVKLGVVARINTTIHLRARLSDRVPFGTGMSTAKIMQLEREGRAFCYYHPQVFVALREVLAHFRHLWASRDTVESWLQQLPASSSSTLKVLGIQSVIAKLCHQCRNQTQFDRQLMEWFDGLKTLQFVRRLQTAYPDMALNEAIQTADFTLPAPNSPNA